MGNIPNSIYYHQHRERMEHFLRALRASELSSHSLSQATQGGLSRNFARMCHGRPARAGGTAKMAVARRAKHKFPPTMDQRADTLCERFALDFLQERRRSPQNTRVFV